MLLFSGDNRFIYYNEPGAMHQYALSLGVPEEVIVLDFAGRSTYDTCYRAKEIFGIKEAILVTQYFHLPRALYICHVLGINAFGVPADRREYSTGPWVYWNIRELPATLNALWQVYVTHPLPVLGEPELISFPGDPMNRNEAIAIVREFIKNENLIRHMLAVEGSYALLC